MDPRIAAMILRVFLQAGFNEAHHACSVENLADKGQPAVLVRACSVYVDKAERCQVVFDAKRAARILCEPADQFLLPTSKETRI